MSRNKGWGLHALSSVVAVTAMASLTTQAAAKSDGDNGVYIVQMAESPALAAAATKPAAGQKIDPNSPVVAGYIAKLKAGQDALLSQVGATRKLYSYGYAVNGFAAEMTASQAAALAKSPNVISVTKDEKRALDTATTPAFIGLAGAGGFWQTTGAKGEGVIIGMVDSGIWPESPSFSGAGFGPIPPRWSGACATGDQFTAANCNN